MLLGFVITVYFMRATFCEHLRCEHYLSRRVAGVFHYDRNSRYTLTFKEARLACERDFGATIADMRQLQAANEGGLEECRAGWISGAEVAYPRVHLNWNCGQNQTGIISYGIRNDLLEKWDVFCYKMDDDCAMFQEAEMPGLPSVGPRRNGSNENCTGHFHGVSPTEHSKTTQTLQREQTTGHAEYETPVTASERDKRKYMTYTYGTGTESLYLTNGLFRGNGKPSKINNDPGQESGPNTDGQTLNVPLSVALQADRANNEFQISSGRNKSLDSNTWQIKNSPSEITALSTNVSDDAPLSSTHLLSAKLSETDSSVQPKQTVEIGFEYFTETTEDNQSNAKPNTVLFKPSPPLKTFRPLNSLETIPVPPSLPPAGGAFESFTEERLVKNLKPSSWFPTASSYDLRTTFSTQSDPPAKELDSELLESKGITKSGSTLINTVDTDVFHPTDTSLPVTSPGVNTVVKSFLSPISSSIERDSIPSLGMMTMDPKALLVNQTGEAVSGAPKTEGRRHEHQQKTVDELRADIQREVNKMGNEADVSITNEGLSLVHTSTVPALSSQNIDKNQTSHYVEILNETQVEVSVDGLNYKTGNVSGGPAALLNLSCTDGNVTWPAPCVAVIQLLEKVVVPNESASSSHSMQTSTPNVTHLPLQPDQKQETSLASPYVTLVTEGLVSSTVATSQDAVTSVPPSTAFVTDSYPLGTMHNTETTSTNWMSARFKVQHIENAAHTTTEQFHRSDSLMTTVDVMTTMVTPSQLDFTIGTTGVTSETTTAMSCGGFLYEEDGDFQSPGFPHAYLSDMDCSWVIVVQPGHLVQLNFRAMVLEEHRGCQYDYISVFDGRASEKRLLGRFCGSELPPPLRSSSNVMTVQMKSDSSVELDGFSAQFHTVKSAEVTGHVKLRRGRNQFEGHVEVDIEGIQGGICAKHWGIREATVVCRQLGFTGSAMAERMPERMDDPPVSVSLVKCRGDEGSLDQCELKRGGGCSTAVRAAVHCRVTESCSVLRDAGVVESGTYIIDPDGPEQGQEPFPVYCDMDSQPGAGVTVVRHNSEARIRVEPCEEAGCYSREVVYQHASLRQLRALIQASFTCVQKVKLDCRHIRFLGAQWGWWTSWDGRRVDSWGGAATGSRRCACGERGDCDLGLKTCNCDANDEVWRSDEGFLSDMVLLPVKEVRFGDTRDIPMEMAFHKIGPLQCSRHKPTDTVPVSCAALKETGITRSGQYLIDPDGMGQGVSQFEVYCDMTSDPLTGVTVVGHDAEGRVRVTPCEDPGCYSREVHYGAALAQLRALIQVSTSCQQHVKVDCRHTRFVGWGWGWWVSWAGEKRLDWGGAKRNSGSCACGKTGTCDRPGLLCNCDSNDHIWRSDEGVLTDKSALPVRAVHFGDTNDIPLEMAFYTIGKLTCRGTGSPIL